MHSTLKVTLSVGLVRSYLRARWAFAQGLTLRGALHLEDLLLTKMWGGEKNEKKSGKIIRKQENENETCLIRTMMHPKE